MGLDKEWLQLKKNCFLVSSVYEIRGTNLYVIN